MIPWIDPDANPQPIFPPVARALREPSGLLAAGGHLNAEWLLAAYRQGIFPWFSPGEPILWWSPDPRMVLFPAELRLTRSLLKTLRKRPFDVRCDTAFAAVMDACAAPRDAQAGTWISADIRAAYGELHQLGWAHSVECWQDNQLVGGLYGVAIGRIFYGESMFHRITDASKVAFAHLVRWLELQGFAVLDCQVNTTHLGSLGGREIPRSEFCLGLQTWAADPPPPAAWPADMMSTIDWSRPQACPP